MIPGEKRWRCSKFQASGETGRHVFLTSGQISIIRPDLALCFIWHGNEDEARKAFVPSLEAVPGARWGVRKTRRFNGLKIFPEAPARSCGTEPA